jgi:hypothetical protein
VTEFPHITLSRGLLTFSIMLPIQSIEGPPPTPHAAPGALGALAATTSAGENGESRQQKPKTLPCKYCAKRFRCVALELVFLVLLLAYIAFSF